MVPIPFGIGFEMTRRGRVPKLVVCEQCAFEYVYIFEQTATGHGTSFLFLDNEGAQGRAAHAAEEILRAGLATGYEVVPCPNCGRIQEHMLPLARKRNRSWMFKAALALFVGSVVLSIGAIFNTHTDLHFGRLSAFSLALWSIMAFSLFTAIGLAVIKWCLSSRFDPNLESAEQRKQRGQDSAVSKGEFLDIMRNWKDEW